MKQWFVKNREALIATTFLIPILLVAFVSIAHVTQWYSITNPMTWAIYLSLAIEIAALSALAGMTVGMRKFIYIPFGIVTLIQLVGNIFYAYQYIHIDSQMFKAWVELTSSLFEMMGVEAGDLAAHKRILAMLSGGLLPMISLTFLHMLVKFKDHSRKPEEVVPQPAAQITPEQAMELANQPDPQPAVIDNNTLNALERMLMKPQAPEPIPEDEIEEYIQRIPERFMRPTPEPSPSPSPEPTPMPTPEALRLTEEDKKVALVEVNKEWVHEIQESGELDGLPPTPEITSAFMRVGDQVRKTNSYDNQSRRV